VTEESKAMAYQQQAGGGMGNGNGGPGGEQHVPQGTEYTLQGINRPETW